MDEVYSVLAQLIGGGDYMGVSLVAPLKLNQVGKLGGKVRIGGFQSAAHQGSTAARARCSHRGIVCRGAQGVLIISRVDEGTGVTDSRYRNLAHGLLDAIRVVSHDCASVRDADAYQLRRGFSILGVGG